MEHHNLSATKWEEILLLKAFRLMDDDERDFQVEVFQGIVKGRSAKKPPALRIVHTVVKMSASV